ncbi:GreA/GreB family elongation factor [Chloroflexota bacterium]
MTGIGQNPSLGKAASYYLAELPLGESGVSQQEVYKFIRWFGRERSFTELTAAEIDNYAEQVSRSDTDYARKFELIKTFLVYAKKKGWSKTNLATHLKTRKGKTKQDPSSGKVVLETISLTQQGYDELETELAALRNERYNAIDEIRTAAADKDFRENAPLAAARERRGHLEGRIIELEGILRAAVVIDEKKKDNLRVSIGDFVILSDLASDKELRYMLVSPREIDVAKGKISSASPMGQAIIGKEQGETVEIEAPVGKLRYQIQRIEH